MGVCRIVQEFRVLCAQVMDEGGMGALRMPYAAGPASIMPVSMHVKACRGAPALPSGPVRLRSACM